ncbi:hypothetical protein BDF21DRAFT_424357 [Thamnidium elegans]|uniref:Uncharacterized protein n=1 Tax=Thamnidium elegans TaxID=101142 RepID=A0A8H7SKN0_9FUNG|nr:hypothetical protein INT48_001475 [Thamnidium elegans]KAI8071830.1 hypothetical protein BDF21DRAFT_424357 [Thamnidium elegans]
MELKGESESDKDLIIYSLNESLQIHKEIVERIQNEKDDIEDQFEQEKSLVKKECIEIEEKRDDGNKQLSKLEAMYNLLLKEVETKRLEYRRMETRFYSHIKSLNSTEQEESVYPIIYQMISQINNLCSSLEGYMKQDITIDLLSLAWSQHTVTLNIIQTHFSDNQLRDTSIISLLTERFIMDIIMEYVLQTSIHPGVSLNNSFETIHDWIDKRNTSWASRLKQQITNFIVSQSNEQSNEIESKKQDIICLLSNSLSHIYDSVDLFNTQITEIIQLSLQLNLAIKLQQQQHKLEILSLQQGSQFNENIMNSVNQGTELILVITPPFVADGPHPFIIPAKVYCA